MGGFLYKLCGTVIEFGSRGNSFKCVREGEGWRKNEKKKKTGRVGSGGFHKEEGCW